MTIKTAIFLTLTFNLLYSSYSIAKEFKPSRDDIAKLAVDTVTAQIKVHADAQLSVTTQGIDSRFSLPNCTSPLQAEISNHRVKALTTVKVSCQLKDQSLWQSFISVKVSIRYKVAVANRILTKGKVITADDLTLQYLDERRLRGAMFNQLQPLTGTRVKRRIGKGSVIYRQNVCYVCKGDTVSIYAQSEHLQIKTIGEALNDGNPNDKIRVRNTKSNRIIGVTVIGVGEVEVKM